MTIAYESAGKGEPVLFIQGAGVPGLGWRPQVEGLADRFHCASFDNRGIGASSAATAPFTIEDMKDDALAVLDALGWESAHVVGHSLGGLVAQALALDHRARVRSVTLMNTFFRGREPSRLTPWIMWVGARTYIGTRRMRRLAFLEMILSASERQRRAADLDAYATELGVLFGRDLADPVPIAMKQLGAAATFDRSERLGELVGMPALVLSGTHDRIALPQFGRALAGAIPGAHYAERDAAHGLPITQATDTNELLAEHFHSASAR